MEEITVDAGDHDQFERDLVGKDAFHSSPRFGRTDEFADLFDDNKTAEYISGVLVVALIFMCIFLCWAVFLCILICMGKRRVGFLSGAPYDATVADKRDEPNPRVKRGRIVFGVFGMIFITFTLILIFVGIANLEQTTTSMSDGAQIGSNIFVDSRGILGKFLDTAQAAAGLRDALVAELEEVFDTRQIVGPNGTVIDFPNRTLAPAQQAAVKYVVNGVDVQEEAAKVVEQLYAWDDLIQSQAADLKSVLDNGEETCDNLHDGLENVTLAQLVYGIPYTVFPALMILLMILTAMGINNSGKDMCTSLCFVPFFAIVVISLVIFTGLFSIGGIMDADFCYGGTNESPDETLLLIMDRKGIDPNSLQYRSARFLVSGCEFDELDPNNEFPLKFIEAFEEGLETAELIFDNFTASLETAGLAAVSEAVGVNVTKIRDEVGDLKGRAVQMLETLKSVLQELACQRIYEVYDKVVNQATCTDLYNGLSWSFISFIIMSFCGMMMLTFRAVLYRPAGDIDDHSWNGVKENEMANGASPDYGVPDEVVGTNAYVQDEGYGNRRDTAEAPTEAPMGGQAQQAYDAVGDDNPFADTGNFEPKKSSWE